ncbi:MAG: FecR family protein [Sphingobacteriaceae bacterium]|nr:MAG: FecR family protein [Sphingobacteriaceae bacterium]
MYLQIYCCKISSIKMKDTAFKKHISRYLKNQLQAEEKQKLDNWLDDLAGNDSFDGLNTAEKAETESRIYKQLTDRISKTEKSISLSIRLKPLLKIAASIALFTTLLFIFRVSLKEVFNIGQYVSIRNYKGKITKTILSDGSIIWLKGNSKLDFPIKFKGGLRKVDLDGEALFEVAKDARHPFIIRCGTLTTRVLGTSFNIKHSINKTEIDVLTGRVFLSSKIAAPITLQPNQKAVYCESKKTLIKEARPVLEIAELTKGTEYNMFFNDARVEDVLHRIEKKFEVEISVKNPKLKDNLITADFTDQSLINTLNMMGEALNLDFEIEGRSVILKNKV